MRTENNYESLLYVAIPARYEYIDTEDILKASQPQSEGKYDYTDTKNRKPSDDCVQAVLKNCHAASRDRARTSAPDFRPSCTQNGQTELKDDWAKDTEKSKIRKNVHPKSNSSPAKPLSHAMFHGLEEPNAEKKADQCKVREIRRCFMI